MAIELMPPMPLAYVTLAIYAIEAIAIAGASYLAYQLTKPRINLWDRPTTITTRGATVQSFTGMVKVAPVFGWAGDRQYGGGGSGKGSLFGGSGSGGKQFKENGWHILGIGPVTGLRVITANGSIIFGVLNTDGSAVWDIQANQWTPASFVAVRPGTSPSGSLIDCPNHAQFIIYWGEQDQPANVLLSQNGSGPSADRPRLADEDNYPIYSQWPGVCHVFWINYPLGTSPTWPQIEYVIERDVMCTALTGDAFMTETSAHWQDTGNNPGHVLWELLTSPFPYGAALPVSMIDSGSVQALATLAASEHVPVNFNTLNGTEGFNFSDVIGWLMTDMGFVIPFVQGQLVVVPVRFVVSGVPTITTDMFENPLPEIEQWHGNFNSDRFVFTIKDMFKWFKSNPIPIDNDAQGLSSQRPRPKDETINTVNNFHTAWTVINRRLPEIMVQGVSYRFKMLRGGRLLEPGQPFILSGIGQLRIGSKEVSLDGSTVDVEAFQDEYSYSPGTYSSGDYSGTSGGLTTEPVDDLYRSFVQVPGSPRTVACFRIRGSSNVTGADLYWSDDNINYIFIGQQNVGCAGGPLNAPIDIAAGSGSPVTIASGPSFTSANGDVSSVQDLGATAYAWQTGVQICLIDDELFFLEGITAVSGGYRLIGMIRAQLGTSAANHAAGAIVYIINAVDVNKIASALLISGTNYFKDIPFTGFALFSGGVTGISLSMS